MINQNVTKSRISSRIREELVFLKGWAQKPGAVGAIKPTGRRAARHMASLLPLETGLPVLELGPGTGVITQAVLDRGTKPGSLFVVEHSSEFCEILKDKFPGISVIKGDAFDLELTLAGIPLQKFCGVIGAVPLLTVSMAKRIQLVDQALSRVKGGGPLVQISYGPRPPVPAIPGKFTVEKSGRIFRNIPPAGIWVYRRPQQ